MRLVDMIMIFYFIIFFKFYSHDFYITIQTIQIHIAATNYMSMFYLKVSLLHMLMLVMWMCVHSLREFLVDHLVLHRKPCI